MLRLEHKFSHLLCDFYLFLLSFKSLEQIPGVFAVHFIHFIIFYRCNQFRSHYLHPNQSGEEI